MAYLSERGARDAAKRVQDLMDKPAVWVIRTWENSGWHFSLNCGTLYVYAHKTGEKKEFSYNTLLGATDKCPGAGETYWSPNAEFSDPNAAVQHQLKVAREYHREMTQSLEHIDKMLGNLSEKVTQ